MQHELSMNWDLAAVFPHFNGPEYAAFLAGIETALDGLEAKAAALPALSPDDLDPWVAFHLLSEALSADFSHLSSYIGCLAAADAGNEAYKKAEAVLSGLYARWKKAAAPAVGLFKDASDEAFAALKARPELAGAEHFLERARTDARLTMTPELEALAADLGVDGLSAWGRLYDAIAGKLDFPMPDPTGGERRVPMSQKRMLLEDPDPTVRKIALKNSNQSWEAIGHVVAAALNAIAGTRLTLLKRRGVPHFLDRAWFESAVSGETIAVMWEAVDAGLDPIADWMRVKAGLLGKPRLGFEDLIAPLPTADPKRRTWSEGVHEVLDAFAVYPKLRDFAAEMFESRCVEAEKRPGKRPGAFCSTSLKTRVSKVYMTYGGGLSDLSTLAHELGHAFHGRILAGARPLAARYPMTLAETASTFAEALIQDAVLASPATDPALKRSVLAARLDDYLIYGCDIRMRFLFEKRFYELREAGEVGVSELCALMLDAQKTAFGDRLDPESLDPWFWASKLHFYITGVSFYNFPYTFGRLLSLGLSALFAKRGEGFFPDYERFLVLTGSRSSEDAVREAFGVDLRARPFWDDALAQARTDLDRFSQTA